MILNQDSSHNDLNRPKIRITVTDSRKNPLLWESMAQDQKQEAIIDAAIKRFAHFGVAKTTMAEIAADLSFSKASLYYYFPDKMNLYAAVFKRITDMNQSGNHEAIRNEKDPFRAISLFLEFRTQFIIKYYNILEFLKNFNPRQIPVELQPIFSNLQKRELKTLTTIIEKGVEAGLFKIDDVKAVAELFFDMLDGFRQKSLSKVNFFPEKKQFQSVLKREKEFAAIFFKGLTK